MKKVITDIRLDSPLREWVAGMRQLLLEYAVNIFGSIVLPIQEYAKVFSPKSNGFIVVGYVKARAGKTTGPEGIIVVASRWLDVKRQRVRIWGSPNKHIQITLNFQK